MERRNPGIIDIQQAAENEYNRNDIPEYGGDETEACLFGLIVAGLFKEAFIHFTLKLSRDGRAGLLHVSQVQVKDYVFKGFFYNVKAKDEDKIWGQCAPPFNMTFDRVL